MARTPIIAGNWKMNNTIVEGKNLVRGLAPLVKDAKVTVVVCPTATALAAVADAALGTNIHVGAQNVHWESHGAFTGEISTGMLNNILADAQTRVQPPTDKRNRMKIYYMTQVGVCPPHFVVFCNERKLFHFSYQRYLENCIRNVFGLEGTPVIMSIREKGDKEE